MKTIQASLPLLVFWPAGLAGQGASDDPRNIKNGFLIPDEGYSDQPYVVITNACGGRLR